MSTFSVLFSVSGSGQFPMDMMRYDCCFPADTSSAYRILTPEDREARRAPREIFLRRTYTGHRSGAVTEARWASFGWIVKIESVTRLD